MVLESFYGRLKPKLLQDADGLFGHMGIEDIYIHSTYSLGFQMTDVYKEPIYVAASLLSPVDSTSHHQLAAYGAGFTEDEARLKAEKEVMQRYGFLYDSRIPDDVTFAPNNIYHQNFHLVPANHWQIREWLNGSFYVDLFRVPNCLRVKFVDLTIPETKGFYLAKAISADAHDVVWGAMDKTFFGALSNIEGLVHPIP